MHNIDDFIKSNRDLFNDSEPPLRHEERFWGKMGKEHTQKKRRSMNWSFKIAALILLLFTLTYGFFKRDLWLHPEDPCTAVNLSEEFYEAEAFYLNKVENNLHKIKKYDEKNRGISYKSFYRDLDEMRTSYTQTKKELCRIPNENKLINSCIYNLQAQEEATVHMLEIIKNKEHQNI